jgi:ribosomal-protein-alanine N-acetyltransferase
MSIFSRFFGRGEATLSEAGLRDARALAALHAASFRRGWSEPEFERLLTQQNVHCDKAVAGSALDGFVISRTAADEAEILSIAVRAARRARGLGRKLLDLHLRRLAGLGVRAVFLEVDERNAAALRLYRRAGFQEVSRRNAYYKNASDSAAALVLRRDLV